jgi:hypothetical protein
MNWIEVLGAYGRTYNTQAAVQADWDADKDFRVIGHTSVTNKSDCDAMGIKVIVRYGKGAEQGGGKLYQVK